MQSEINKRQGEGMYALSTKNKKMILWAISKGQLLFNWDHTSSITEDETRELQNDNNKGELLKLKSFFAVFHPEKI